MLIRKIKRTARSTFLIVTTLLLLFGCAQQPSNPTNVKWEQHQQRLAKLNHYSASGKLGFISPEERRSMNFYWQQDGLNTQLRLTSVFGQTLLKLTMTPEQTQIDTYEGEHYQSLDGEQLLHQLTGLVIPLNQLPNWLKGAANQGDQYTLLETNTLASQSSQVANQLWQINYQRYSDIKVNDTVLPLPSLLQLKQQDIKINLQILQWNIE
jgi:outer membrane lipoprotein LolB